MSSPQLDPARWERVKDIFVSALELSSESARLQFVESRSAGDAIVQAEVLRLLHFTPPTGSSGAFIDRAPMAPGLLQQAGFPPSAHASLEPGELLGDRFRVVRRVGVGGMGEVYEAEDLYLQTRIAIKTIRPEIAGDPHILERFKREINLARQVTHPNVCRVYDLVSVRRTGSGAPLEFLTMEFLEGETLSHMLRADGPMKLREALPLIEQMAAALSAAHRAGVVHRDFKSSNVFLANLPDGNVRAVVTDFGLARSTSGEASAHTASGWGAGTPLYMAPEQLEGKPAGPAADIYAFGVVMYEMAVNAVPHQNESPLLIAVRRLKEKPQPPHLVNQNVDLRWEAAILRCLETKPEDRFANPEAIVAAIESRHSLSLPYVRASRIRRVGWVGVSAAAVALVGALGFYQVSKPASLSPEAQRLFSEGENAIADGTFLKASLQLEKVVALQPDHLPAAVRLAEAYYEQDQPSKSQQQLLKVSDRWVFWSADRHLREGTRRLLVRDFDGAIAELKKRVKEPGARLDLARMYQRASLLIEAEAEYAAVLEKDVSHPAALLQMGTLKGQMGNGPKAEEYFESAMAAYKLRGNVEGQGEVAMQRAAMHAGIFSPTLRPNSLEEAEKFAGQALALVPQGGGISLEVRAKLALARVAVMSSKPEKAEVLAAEAMEGARRNGNELLVVQGLNDLGLAQLSHGQDEEANQMYTEGLRIASANGAPYFENLSKLGLAKASIRLRQEEKALKLVAEALEFFQANRFRLQIFDSWKTRGEAYYSQAKLAEALVAYNRALSLADKPWELGARTRLRRSILNVELRKGNFPTAITLYKELVRAHQESGALTYYWTARYNLSDALLSLGRLGEALREANAVASEQENPSLRQEALRRRAVILADQGLNDAAITQLDQLEKEQSKGNRESIRLRLCYVHAFAKHPQEALRRCNELLADKSLSDLIKPDVYQALAQTYLHLKQPGLAAEAARKSLEMYQKMQSEDQSFCGFSQLAAAKLAAGDPLAGEFQKKAKRQFQSFTGSWSHEDRLTYLNRYSIQIMVKSAQLKLQ